MIPKYHCEFNPIECNYRYQNNYLEFCNCLLVQECVKVLQGQKHCGYFSWLCREGTLTSDEVVKKEQCQKYFVSCQRCCHHQVSNCYYHILRFLGSIPNLSLLLLGTWMPIEEERGCKPGQRKWVRGLRNIPRGRPLA